MRRWRGYTDVPLNTAGFAQVKSLEQRLGMLDRIYFDHLQRCRKTAEGLNPYQLKQDDGPRPWRMGRLFDGEVINDDSLNIARKFILSPELDPPGGEFFGKWSNEWLKWLQNLKYGHAAVGIVTHNRNIQYLYSLYEGQFVYKLYDCVGPDYCSVHYFNPNTNHIAPWNYRYTPKGIYLIRHGETSFGT